MDSLFFWRWLAILMGLVMATTQANGATPIPEALQRTLAAKCLDCHDATEKRAT